ncbi:hypothetical protein [Oceanobacillus salinisoli]|uniref:hypothetical protein n=1 Tax=Oceanobacillus salinisoli TaxID=2678611 RepID=UPI0012E18E8B|nr:hypothetical protein [Oceanobacillus salinisoli]
MSILIVNCNHWVGFHIINTILDLDYDVDGIKGTNQNNDLSLFFGRNSSFSFVTEENLKPYQSCIIIGEYHHTENIKAEQKFLIGLEDEDGASEREDIVTIQAPLLYGEWMPMNEKGIYKNNRFIPFDSEEFINNAIYIQVFTSALLQWMKSSTLPKYIEVNPVHSNRQLKLENFVYLRDNGPKEKKIEDVKKHYKLYKNFY